LIRPTDPASPARASSPKTAHPIDPHEAHHAGLSRRQWWWRKTALPLLTSLSLHAGVVVIGLLCFTAYRVINQPPQVQEQKVDPESTMDPTPVDLHDLKIDKFPIPMPKSGDPGNTAFPKNFGPPVKTSGPRTVTTPDIDPGVFSHTKPNSNAPSGPDDEGLPSWVTARPGTFDPGGDDGSRPRTRKRLPPPTSTAYVCDASGSMMEKMPALKQELSKAVMRLRPWQEFSIIFFQDEQPTALSPSLVRATPENQRAAEAFLNDATTVGTTDPIPGIKKAFAQHPQIMFLLTDGDFPDNDAVLAEIRSLEKQQHVVIHTIAFVGDNDRNTKFLSLLKQVAQETGGSFKKVDAEALDEN
jgi:hypothetical protein